MAISFNKTTFLCLWEIQCMITAFFSPQGLVSLVSLWELTKVLIKSVCSGKAKPPDKIAEGSTQAVTDSKSPSPSDQEEGPQSTKEEPADQISEQEDQVSELKDTLKEESGPLEEEENNASVPSKDEANSEPLPVSDTQAPEQKPAYVQPPCFIPKPPEASSSIPVQSTAPCFIPKPAEPLRGKESPSINSRIPVKGVLCQSDNRHYCLADAYFCIPCRFLHSQTTHPLSCSCCNFFHLTRYHDSEQIFTMKISNNTIAATCPIMPWFSWMRTSSIS